MEIPALNLSGKWPPSWAFAYDTAQREGNLMHAPVFVTEFGTGEDSDARTIEPTLDQAELHGAGGTIWSWKSGCGTDPASDWCTKNQSWTMFAPAMPVPGAPNASLPPNGPLYPRRERMMSRVHSRGTLGESLGFFYNTTDRSFALRVNVSAEQAAGGCAGAGAGSSAAWGAAIQRALSGAQWEGPLALAATANGSVGELYLPRSITPAQANASVVSGPAAILGSLQWADGSRSVYYCVTGPGVAVLGVPPSSSSSSSSASSWGEAGGWGGDLRPRLLLGQAAAAGSAEGREALGRAHEALLRALPGGGAAEAARAASEGMGARIVEQRSELVREAARQAGFALP